MLSCKETTKLVSQSLDRPLPLRRRLSVWMHLSMCRLCAAFRRDQLVLRKRILDERDQGPLPANASSVKLPIEARQRIQKLLESR
tara:strand:+ start:1221 stop:1475 length:255 start_codon:yes stop_codon:yes gene_type:complete